MNAKELFEQHCKEGKIDRHDVTESDVVDFGEWLFKQVAERLKGLQRWENYYGSSLVTETDGCWVEWDDIETLISELENPGK